MLSWVPAAILTGASASKKHVLGALRFACLPHPGQVPAAGLWVLQSIPSPLVTTWFQRLCSSGTTITYMSTTAHRTHNRLPGQQDCAPLPANIVHMPTCQHHVPGYPTMPPLNGVALQQCLWLHMRHMPAAAFFALNPKLLSISSLTALDGTLEEVTLTCPPHRPCCGRYPVPEQTKLTKLLLT